MLANDWSHVRYAVMIDTFLFDLPESVTVDHLPMCRGSDEVVARVLYLFPAIVSVPPGWKAESKWIAELEKEKVDRL